ncbi:MAG: YbdD/YjiX family protein [Gemmatimonadota bacterium]
MSPSLLPSRFSLLLATVRRVFGMPDYAAHLEHLRIAHPGCPVPSEREYFDAFLQGRYREGASRCC